MELSVLLVGKRFTNFYWRFPKFWFYFWHDTTDIMLFYFNENSDSLMWERVFQAQKMFHFGSGKYLNVKYYMTKKSSYVHKNISIAKSKF